MTLQKATVFRYDALLSAVSSNGSELRSVRTQVTTLSPIPASV